MHYLKVKLLHHSRFSLTSMAAVVDRQQLITVHAGGLAGLIKDVAAMIKTRNQPQIPSVMRFLGLLRRFKNCFIISIGDPLKQ